MTPVTDSKVMGENKCQEMFKKLIVNPGIQVLPDDLCFNRPFFKEVILSERLIKIGCRTFARCKSLLEIKICSTIESIGVGSSEQCQRLRKSSLNFHHLRPIG